MLVLVIFPTKKLDWTKIFQTAFVKFLGDITKGGRFHETHHACKDGLQTGV
jgi:hypothetical protein